MGPVGVVNASQGLWRAQAQKGHVQGHTQMGNECELGTSKGQVKTEKAGAQSSFVHAGGWCCLVLNRSPGPGEKQTLPPPPRKWEAPCMLYFCSAVPPLVCLSMSCPSGKLLQWLQGLHHVSPLKPSVSLGAGWLPGKFLHAHASRLLTMTVSPLHVPSRKVKLCSCLGSNPGSANY